jgi:hypothetical protein
MCKHNFDGTLCDPSDYQASGGKGRTVLVHTCEHSPLLPQKIPREDRSHTHGTVLHFVAVKLQLMQSV